MNWKWFNEQEDPLIVGLHPKLVGLLDEAREVAGIPFILTSGRRSFKDNAMAGGVIDSAHLLGLAADLRVDTSSDQLKIVRSLLHCGARRIVQGIQIIDGRVDYFNVHVDIDSEKPECLAIKVYGSKESLKAAYA